MTSTSPETAQTPHDAVAGGEPARWAGVVAGAVLAVFSWIAVRSHGLINSEQASLAAEVVTPIVVGLVPVAGAEVLRRFVRPVEKRLDVSDRNRAKVEAWLAEQGLVPVSAALLGSTSAANPAIRAAAPAAAATPTVSTPPPVHDQAVLTAAILDNLRKGLPSTGDTANAATGSTPIGDAAEAAAHATATPTADVPSAPPAS